MKGVTTVGIKRGTLDTRIICSEKIYDNDMGVEL